MRSSAAFAAASRAAFRDAARVAMAALNALIDEGMVENAQRMGDILDGELKRLVSKRKIALDTRGRGLLRALIIDDAQKPGELAYDVCLAMRDRGVLAKPTHGNIIRLAPPLVIDEGQLDAAVSSLDEALALWD